MVFLVSVRRSVTRKTYRQVHGESRISIEDYAMAMIDEVEKPKHVGRRFTGGY